MCSKIRSPSPSPPSSLPLPFSCSSSPYKDTHTEYSIHFLLFVNSINIQLKPQISIVYWHWLNWNQKFYKKKNDYVLPASLFFPFIVPATSFYWHKHLLAGMAVIVCTCYWLNGGTGLISIFSLNCHMYKHNKWSLCSICQAAMSKTSFPFSRISTSPLLCCCSEGMNNLKKNIFFSQQAVPPWTLSSNFSS